MNALSARVVHKKIMYMVVSYLLPAAIVCCVQRIGFNPARPALQDSGRVVFVRLLRQRRVRPALSFSPGRTTPWVPWLTPPTSVNTGRLYSPTALPTPRRVFNCQRRSTSADAGMMWTVLLLCRVRYVSWTSDDDDVHIAWTLRQQLHNSYT